MESKDDDAGECAKGKSASQKLPKTVSEQLAYFDDIRKQDAKPMHVEIQSPAGKLDDDEDL
ncbi:hypothetical protein [Glutamicibacter arilaitensis]|uniref:hypothetical protein n=1 Tax=Glutamicibacter arilaitensis TaxID=256701 RepID=UPI00384E4AFD